MLIRSGKVQLLFWSAFFSIVLYLWLVAVGLQTFVLPDEKSMHMPQDVVLLLFVLFGLLTVTIVAGIFVAIMIDNAFYKKFFGGFIMVAFATVLVTKGMFG